MQIELEDIIDNGEDDIYFISTNGKNDYRWKRNNLIFDLVGELKKEDALGIINSINYEKIETNF